MNKKYKGYIFKGAVIAALGFIALSCITGMGLYGGQLNAYLIEMFGRWRYPLAGLLSWFIWIYANRRRRLTLMFVYFSVCTLFIAASYQAIRSGGNGQFICNVSNGITSAIGGGLHLISLAFISAPFFRRGGAINEAVKGFIQDIAPEPGFNLFVEDYIERPADVSASYTPQAAKFSALLRDRKFMRGANLIPLGVSQSGKPLYEELGDDAAHFLVAGKTGSGKTCFLQAAIAALGMKNSPDDLQFILIDGVRRGLKPLCCLPHVLHDDVLSEDSDVIAALQSVTDMLKGRIQDDICKPKVVIVIDEIDGYFLDKNTGKQIGPLITNIVKKGRQFGVHLIMGSQRPSGDLISAHILSMMKRVCLKVELPRYSENIIEAPDGAALKGRGDLLYFSDGELTRAQGYYLSPDDMRDIVNHFVNMPRAAYLTEPEADGVIDIDSYRHTQNNTKTHPPDSVHVQNMYGGGGYGVCTDGTARLRGAGTYSTDGDIDAQIVSIYNGGGISMSQLAARLGITKRRVQTVIEAYRKTAGTQRYKTRA